MTERDPHDAYYTPSELATMCLRVASRDLAARETITVLEPMAGGASFLRAANELWHPHVLRGCDIDPLALELSHPHPIAVDHAPIVDWNPRTQGAVWIFTNPAYRKVYQVIAQLRALQARTDAEVVGLLLRGTTAEQLMCGEDPPCDIYMSDLRPTWNGPGGELHRRRRKDGTPGSKQSDNTGLAWCLWQRPAHMARRLDYTRLRGLPPWRPKGRRTE
jgi:hypothetical protein